VSVAGVQFSEAFDKYWHAQHQALAQLSSRGVHRIVEGAGHLIQLDKPQAIIDAVDEVLSKLPGGRR